MSKVLYRYVCGDSPELRDALDRRGVRYELPSPLPGTQKWAVFTLEGARLGDPELRLAVERAKISCLASRKYTKREMDGALFLTVRCDYDKLRVREDPQTTWEYPCGHGDGVFCRRVQAGPFVCAGPFRWTGQHHWVSETGFSPPLFCDAAARRAIENAGIAGARFEPVFVGGGTEPSADIHQLTPAAVLPHEALILPRDGKECRLKPCPVCGAPHYLLAGTFQLRVRTGFLTGDADVYATAALFGDMYARSMYIVSQRFYALLREKGLDRGLRFEPVEIENP